MRKDLMDELKQRTDRRKEEEPCILESEVIAAIASHVQ